MSEEIMQLIERAVKHIPKYSDENVRVIPIAESKNFIYKVEAGTDLLKVRVLPFEPACLELHKYLINNAQFRVPGIVEIVWLEDKMVKVMEWIPGKNLHEICGKNEFMFLADEYFYKWGECVAEINNIEFATMQITITDIWWWNFIQDNNEDVILCDMSKLALTVCPEKDVVNSIIMNTTMPLDKKMAFIDGYCLKRTFNPKYNHWKALKYFAKKVENELTCNSIS